jgi:hypothetical protein
MYESLEARLAAAQKRVKKQTQRKAASKEYGSNPTKQNGAPIKNTADFSAWKP